MDSMLKKRVAVVTQDGRYIVGDFRGFDQSTNLVLTNSSERIVSTHRGMVHVPLGLYMIRGDNVAMVGEIDVDHDDSIDPEDVRAEPLQQIIH